MVMVVRCAERHAAGGPLRVPRLMPRSDARPGAADGPLRGPRLTALGTNGNMRGVWEGGAVMAGSSFLRLRGATHPVLALPDLGPMFVPATLEHNKRSGL